MAKKFNATVFVKGVDRKCTSIYGNPSYWVTFEVDDNEYKGFTASNAQCGYGVRDLVGKKCVIGYHYTKKGNIIIDNMKEV